MTAVLGAPVPSLVVWGRSPDADLIYRRLVSLGPCSAAQLVRDLGMSRKRVTAALEELAEIGAAATRPAAGRREPPWAPREPARVIASLRRSRLREVAAEDTERRHRDGRALTDRLVDQLVIGDGLRHLRTRQLTRERLADLATVARQEQLAMNPEPVFEAESARSGVSTDRVLLGRGVRVRVLGVQSATMPDPMRPHGRDPAEARPEYRQAPAVPMKLFVVDRAVALFPAVPGDLGRGYLEVTQSPVVAALAALFEQHWRASPDPGRRQGPPPSLDRRERALIRLLAQGHTDAMAARQLRISTRSVTSVLRGLMDRLGVENRFQLGLALGALRVVPLPRKADEPES
jgi:DNA-binding CsgD family transcriptional regulator